MAYHRHDDWKPLVGRWVQIRNMGVLIDQGVIDAVTADDNILWLSSGGALTRKLFMRGDHVDVWVDYAWEASI